MIEASNTSCSWFWLKFNFFAIWQAITQVRFWCDCKAGCMESSAEDIALKADGSEILNIELDSSICKYYRINLFANDFLRTFLLVFILACPILIDGFLIGLALLKGWLREWLRSILSSQTPCRSKANHRPRKR